MVQSGAIRFWTGFILFWDHGPGDVRDIVRRAVPSGSTGRGVWHSQRKCPPDAVTDAIARQIAPDLGMTPDALRPYPSTRLGNERIAGDGASARRVEVEIWLDADGRPLPTDRTASGPCDPTHGQATPTAKPLRCTLHTCSATIVGQGVVADVEAGTIENTYMHAPDDASSSLDTAAERGHADLAPDLRPPG